MSLRVPLVILDHKEYYVPNNARLTDTTNYEQHESSHKKIHYILCEFPTTQQTRDSY